MRFKYKVQELQGSTMDMTPIIDIVFNLLLFFLLSSSYVQHSALEVNLPTADSSEVVVGEAVIVELTRQDLIFFQGQPVANAAELEEKMKEVYNQPEALAQRPLLIKADAHVFHGRVVTVLDLARKVGVKTLNVATLPGFEEVPAVEEHP